MKLWPWSALERQKQQISRLEAQLNACHMAAIGAFHGLPKAPDQGPQYKGEPRPVFQAQIDPWCWSPALTEIMRLVHLLDQYPEPPPGRHAVPLPILNPLKETHSEKAARQASTSTQSGHFDPASGQAPDATRQVGDFNPLDPRIR